MIEKVVARKLDNKFYDIEKATPLFTVKKTFGEKYGENPDDDWTETLYKKKSGEYFVLGQGGKNSPYNKIEDGKEVGGFRYEIWLQSNYNSARNWVHSNCPEKLEEIFMENKDDKQKVTSLTLSPKARLNLKRKAREQNKSISEIVRTWAESLYE